MYRNTIEGVNHSATSFTPFTFSCQNFNVYSQLITLGVRNENIHPHGTVELLFRPEKVDDIDFFYQQLSSSETMVKNFTFEQIDWMRLNKTALADRFKTIFMNVEPAALKAEQTSYRIASLVSQYKSIGVKLLIEITERSSEWGNISFQKIKKLGVDLVLDDYQLNAHNHISIDQFSPIFSAVKLCIDDYEIGELISIISVAVNKNMRVVIEKIEDKLQYSLIRDFFPFALMQGYYIEKPKILI
ncbi:EAL domain-containing protein [Vibrio sp. YMD68]|uniref:EAL domain-containing protein n=1 Tax=Vibrio sp. YMD68 TaxID=3042300 RepID=UPI00249AF542|nr:EAL domain-containing protein [Vibrio sp. YMD68]WGV98013.1 EAL domain-containing protein [Vibrio sp. YMD68]